MVHPSGLKQRQSPHWPNEESWFRLQVLLTSVNLGKVGNLGFSVVKLMLTSERPLSAITSHTLKFLTIGLLSRGEAGPRLCRRVSTWQKVVIFVPGRLC